VAGAGKASQGWKERPSQNRIVTLFTCATTG
jgi:hypothetical protein